LGLERTSNYTTRKPRYPGEQGYHFVSEAEFQNKFKQNEIIESYFRKSNNSFYGIPAPARTGIVQSEIMGLVALSVYLDVDTETLLTRLKKRSDTNEIPEERLAEDAYYEAFKEWSDVIYDYNGVTVEQGVEDIITMMQEAGFTY
jgi:guanylate kinase